MRQQDRTDITTDRPIELPPLNIGSGRLNMVTSSFYYSDGRDKDKSSRRILDSDSTTTTTNNTATLINT